MAFGFSPVDLGEDLDRLLTPILDSSPLGCSIVGGGSILYR